MSFLFGNGDLHVVNHYPILPYLIPMAERAPGKGLEGIKNGPVERSSAIPMEEIPSPMDTAQSAKWTGFWKTVRDTARLKMPREVRKVAMRQSGTGAPPFGDSVWTNSNIFLKPGVVGATQLYPTPVGELGHAPPASSTSMTPPMNLDFPTVDNNNFF